MSNYALWSKRGLIVIFVAALIFPRLRDQLTSNLDRLGLIYTFNAIPHSPYACLFASEICRDEAAQWRISGLYNGSLRFSSLPQHALYESGGQIDIDCGQRNLCLLAKAGLLLQEGNSMTAIEILRGLPRSALYLIHISDQINESASAIPLLELSLAIEETKMGYFKLGQLSLANNEFTEAENAFLSALMAASTKANTNLTPKIYLAMGKVYRAQGNMTLAQKSYEQILALEPDSVPAIVGLANLELARGNDEHAQTLLRNGLRRHPNSIQLRYWLARTYTATEEYDLALKELQLLTDSKSTEHPPTWRLLGDVRWKLGDLVGAYEAYKVYSQLEPSDKSAMRSRLELRSLLDQGTQKLR